MPELGTAEAGTDGLHALLAQAGGGALYTFTLRPKKILFQMIRLQEIAVTTTISA